MEVKKNRSYPVSIIVGILVFVALCSLGVSMYVHAQSDFAPPGKSAPEYPDGFNVPTVSSLIQIDGSVGQTQTIYSPLVVASTTNPVATNVASAFLARPEYLAGFIGYAGSSQPQFPALYPSTGVGLYGFASDSVSSVGVYGSSPDIGVSGVAGSASAYAGYFYGNTRVEGDLIVSNTTTAAVLRATSTAADRAALQAKNGMVLGGQFTTGLYARSLNQYALYGQSMDTSTSSVHITHIVPLNAPSPMTQVRAVTYAGAGYAGAYGWATNGNGIAIWQTPNSIMTQSRPLLIATSTPNSNGYGIWAEGDRNAAMFFGDVITDEDAKVVIGDMVMTECLIAKFIRWCNNYKGPTGNNWTQGCPDKCSDDGSCPGAVTGC